MCELIQFKLVMINYIDLLLQKIPDPLFIVHNRWNQFKKMLQDEKISVQEISQYVSNLDISKHQKTEPMENPKIIDNQLLLDNIQKQTLKNCQSCRILTTSPIKGDLKAKNGLSPPTIKNNEKLQTPGQLKFKLISPQESHKFPQSAREKIVLSIQTGIRQFERNKQSLISIMQNSREIQSPGREDSKSQISARIYSRYQQRRDPFRLVKEIGNLA